MLSPLPRRSVWAYCVAHFTQPCQPSPIWQSGRPAHCPFRGLLGVHSRYGLHTRAVTVYRDTLSEGFSHFVTSIAAPDAAPTHCAARRCDAPSIRRPAYRTAVRGRRLLCRDPCRSVWSWLAARTRAKQRHARLVLLCPFASAENLPITLAAQPDRRHRTSSYNSTSLRLALSGETE